MADFPVSLDDLIAYVRDLNSGAAPLNNLADAVQVASKIGAQSDALIGYFVDQARRAGAPWSEIGGYMGVSKQAVQKRFTPRVDIHDFDPDSGPFSRFTDRARHVVAMARVIAAMSGSAQTATEHLTVGLLSEPDGIAAKIIHRFGVSDDQLAEAFALELPVAAEMPDRGAVPFSEDARRTLRETRNAALQLGHNYIGTEHVLLGIARDQGEAAQKLADLGLDLPVLEKAVEYSVKKMMKRQK